MSKRNEHGVVLAMAVPHPDATRNARGEKVTVYWMGPADPKRWLESQKHAARFGDERLARHTHGLLATPVPNQHAALRARIWAEPALHTRNGGPTSPIITAPPTPEQEPRPVRTLLAVDGNSLAHRAWHAYERSGMTDPSSGRPIFAVYGFLALLVGVCDKVRPDGLVVGFDDRAGSARRDRYDGYKANRGERSPDLYAQMDDVVELLRDLGLHVVTPAGLEADDVLGSAAATAAAAGWRCVIATSDKDSFGLITDTTSVLRLVNGLDNAVLMDGAALVDKYGVRPDQWLDYVALVGDASDNLPGVPGIGPKTAVKLLAACGDVDTALADPDAAAAAVGVAAARRLATAEARAALERNRDIMAIARDVPVDLSVCGPAADPGVVSAQLRRRNLPSLVHRAVAALCWTPAEVDQPAAPAYTPPELPPEPVQGDLFAAVAG